MRVSDRELQDFRALVTGRTKGIGHAVATRLHESGAKVLVTARTAPSGMPDTDFVAADVATPDACATVVDAVSDRFGSVDVVVHVVGGSSAPAGGFAVLDDREWQRALDLNLLPAFRLDRALLPAMLDRGTHMPHRSRGLAVVLEAASLFRTDHCARAADLISTTR